MLLDTQNMYRKSFKNVFRASKRLKNLPELETIIYPFENKPLEKLINIGLGDKIKTVGYQHSSLTPRHFSLIMNDDELKITPLPHKLITLGDITKQWLIKKCNFPSNKVIKGVALRQGKINTILKKTFSPKNAKLLFVFSSSNYEIIKTIEILKNISILENEQKMWKSLDNLNENLDLTSLSCYMRRK